MKKTHLVRLAFLALGISLLSGCLFVTPEDEGYRHRGERGYERDWHRDGEHRDGGRRYEDPRDDERR